MRALWLPEVLRAAGLNVFEVDGWRTRGRELDSTDGVMVHHTASNPSSTLATNLHVVTNGTGATPGPIAQALVWRNGDWHVIAAGKANHAGAGGPWPPLGLPYSPPGQLSIGNARLLGVECVNSGVGEPWPDVQVDSMLAGFAAILRHLGLDETGTLTHAEWAPSRKIDPAGPNTRIAFAPGSPTRTWSGTAWRTAVAHRITLPAPQPPPEEDDEPMLRLIQVHGDPAQLILNGIEVSTAVSEQIIADLRTAGVLSTDPPRQIPRRALRAFRLVGPPPDYTGVGPGWADPTTTPDDFGSWVK